MEVLRVVLTSLIDDSAFRPNRTESDRYDSIIVCEHSRNCPTRDQVFGLVFESRPDVQKRGLEESLNLRNQQSISLASLDVADPQILVGCELLPLAPRPSSEPPPQLFPGRKPNGSVSISLPG